VTKINITCIYFPLSYTFFVIFILLRGLEEGRITTKVQLAYRGVLLPNLLCELCQPVDETFNHISYYIAINLMLSTCDNGLSFNIDPFFIQ